MVIVATEKEKDAMFNPCIQKIKKNQFLKSANFPCVVLTNLLSGLTFRCPYTLDPNLGAHNNWCIDSTHSLSEACVSLFSMSGETLI